LSPAGDSSCAISWSFMFVCPNDEGLIDYLCQSTLPLYHNLR
jgi:hypothetical protein